MDRPGRTRRRREGSSARVSRTPMRGAVRRRSFAYGPQTLARASCQVVAERISQRSPGVPRETSAPKLASGPRESSRGARAISHMSERTPSLVGVSQVTSCASDLRRSSRASACARLSTSPYDRACTATGDLLRHANHVQRRAQCGRAKDVRRVRRIECTDRLVHLSTQSRVRGPA
jgi:hypothetical protein